MAPADPTPVFTGSGAPSAEDRALLPGDVAAVTSAGNALRREFDTSSRPGDFDDIRRLMDGNDALSSGYLSDALRATRPDAQWSEDEDEVGLLPAGEWWVTDPVEGNINKAHGMAEFCVSATLVRRATLGGSPWTLAGTDFCAATAGLHAEAVGVLSTVE